MPLLFIFKVWFIIWCYNKYKEGKMKINLGNFKSNFLLFTLFFLVSCGESTKRPAYIGVIESVETYKDVENGVICYSKSYDSLSCVKLDLDAKKEIAMLNVEIIRLQAELAKNELDTMQ